MIPFYVQVNIMSIDIGQKSIHKTFLKSKRTFFFNKILKSCPDFPLSNLKAFIGPVRINQADSIGPNSPQRLKHFSV